VAELRSECPRCGDWSWPTGAAWRDEQDGHTHIGFKCPQDHPFDSYRPEWEQQGLIPARDSEASVVKEKSSRVDVIFLPMIAIFVVVLVIALRGAETSGGRVGASIVFGGLAVGFFALWLIMRLRPARLEVTREAVTYAKEKGKRSEQLLHTFGELRLVYVLMGNSRQPELQLDGTEASINVNTFDAQQVLRACEDRGWQILN
jgi:hypothetical protein